MDEEIWKEIPGYEGRYQVSNYGRVIGPRGKVLKPWLNKNYEFVHLGDPKKKFAVHQLVMLAFNGPYSEGCVICHTDGNSRNNTLSNLRYDTMRENTWDTYRTNHINTQKLKAEEIGIIKKRVSAGERVSDLAREYGVDRNTIWRAYSGRTFKGVDPHS